MEREFCAQNMRQKRNSHGRIGEQQYTLNKEKHSKVVHRQEFSKREEQAKRYQKNIQNAKRSMVKYRSRKDRYT